ncbi:MAG: hypothetical protein AB1603_00950 [Chloroflexota bacterium]
MNRKLKIVLPVLALILAIGTGIGIAAARGPYSGIRTTSTTDAGPGYAYCWGPGGEYRLGAWTLERVAGTLGLTAAELQAELEAGKTLLEVAQANGVSEEALTEAILAPHLERIELMVKYGRLTAEQAATITEQARQRVATLIRADLSGFVGESWSGYAGSGGCMGRGYAGGWGMMGRGYWQGQGITPGPRTGFGFGGMMGRW